jgi:NADH-ubiquinone oxidoreductase chain 5
MAGASAIYETDIKKIVALSTLRQLGLIIAAIGAGLYEIAFFHILTHAYFKALLFITVGQMIHISRDYQDLRKIGLYASNFPVSLAFSIRANLSLCGLPFLAGFYSKDAIVELILTSSFPA